MIIINPEIVTPAKLISTNVAVSQYAAWSNVTNYMVGDKVYYTPAGASYTHDYEAILTNTNKQPDLYPNDWLDLGASNRFRLFDQIVSNPTTNTGSIDFTVRMVAIVNGVTLFNVSAASVQVIMTDPVDGVVYDRTIVLTDYSNIIDYFTYQYQPVGERETETTFLDMPTYTAADIRIIIDAGASVASCGEIALGMQNVIGIANFGTTIGIRDYSRKEIDQFGNFIIVERRFAKLVDYDVTMETAGLARIQRLFARIRATPVVAIGDEARDETILYGFYKDFKVPISSPIICNATIQFEGLT